MPQLHLYNSLKVSVLNDLIPSLYARQNWEFELLNSNLFNESIIKLIIASENEEEEKKDKKNKFSNENDYLDKSELPKILNIDKFGDNQVNKSQERDHLEQEKQKF